MKKRLGIVIASVLASILCVIGLTACGGGGAVQAHLTENTQERVVIAIDKTDGKATVMDALELLKDEVSVVSETGAYGAFITAINGAENVVTESTATTSKGYSWNLYTSDMSNAYEETTITVNGTTCGMAAFGASSLVVKQGYVYVWAYEYYDYSW